ncbi:hypothetical protein [Brevibacterium antiquum]|uniref:LPXTG-motif cell wall anchor domain-containing protein n=1 Tax=Brevibacterium antiquum TaxID=234835 RepID=A0A2H1IFL6_9MICO|nr:hypothetical protein [Brevibacterium antiquum]SMX73965.1 hypothetical protein BANT10_00824 [Brevibacterium antiquum]
MKRLALAASIALAVSTIGFGPAAANTLTTTEVLAAQEGAESASDGAADPDTGATESEGDAEAGQDDGRESSDPDVPGPPADETASPDADEEGASKDGAIDGAEESEAIDASFSLEKTEMTAEEIGDPSQGIRYTVDSLNAGDVVTAEPGEATSTTVVSDGAFTGTILGNTELKTGDTLEVRVTVKRDGEESKTFSSSVEVVAADDEDADLTVLPETQNLDDFMNDGVQIILANCAMDDEVNFRITGKDDSDTVIWEDTQRAAGEDAAGLTTFSPDTGGSGWIGDFVVTASCGDTSAETTFTVTDTEGEDSNSVLTVSPKTQGVQEFLKNGVNITLVNCVMDDDVTFRVSTKHDPDTTIWEETQRAGEDAAGYANFVPDGDGGPGWVDEFLVMASCGDVSMETTFTVTADEGVIDPKLSIDPEKISGEDFIKRDKGVTITVTECQPGSDVQFEVWGFEPSEKLYEQTAEANENGAASVQVYGIDSRPEAYAGTYKVITVCMEHAMNAEFVVTSGGGAAGGSDAGPDDSGDAGSMPRTGAELTGLGAGAALILAGAATIIFARRRAQLGS